MEASTPSGLVGRREAGRPRQVQTIISTTAAEVVPEQVKYLDDGRLPVGEISLYAGAPGRGKTQLALLNSAKLTRGTLEGELRGKPADVAFISWEDSTAHCLVPRFLAAGGDPERIHFFEAKHTERLTDDPVLELPGDVPVIRAWLERTQARLLVADPLIALIPTALSGHKDQHVRRALAPLSKLAHDLDVAVVGIMHLTKDTEQEALNRINGSVAFGAAARSVLILAEDPEDPEGEKGNRRILGHVKSNLGPKQPSVKYRLESKVVATKAGRISTCLIQRTGESTLSAGDLLDSAASSTEAAARNEARAFLLCELSDGPKASSALRERAEGEAGLNWRTVERAKGSVGARSVRDGKGWKWEIPQSGSKGEDRPREKGVGLVGVDGLETGEDRQGRQDRQGGFSREATEDEERLFNRLVEDHASLTAAGCIDSATANGRPA